MPSARASRSLSRRLDEAAARATSLLEPASISSIVRFLDGELTAGGGFRGRARASDPYYTMFGIDCLVALDQPLPRDRLAAALDELGDGDGLDAAHLCALARSAQRLGDDARARRALDHFVELRTPRGGYRLTPDACDDLDSVYASFMAVLAHDAVGVPVDEIELLPAAIESLRCADGGFADRPGVSCSTTTVTAAATMLDWRCFQPVDRRTTRALIARTAPHGGFVAADQVATPDLLSTATAMLALDTASMPTASPRAATFDLVEACWHADGGFVAHPFDSRPDCEYSFYALTTLGVLAGGAA